MKKTYFCSDLHMGHSNIIKYTNRPFKHVDEMNEAIIRNFNSIVKPEDDVYCLGDFSFKDPEKYLRRFNGNWHLIKGNHDPKEVRNAGFVWVKDVAMVRVPLANGQVQDVFCSHYAHRVWNKAHYGVLHVFGHSHNSLPPFCKSMDVGVDCNNYKPFSIEEIMEKLKNQPLITHH